MRRNLNSGRSAFLHAYFNIQEERIDSDTHTSNIFRLASFEKYCHIFHPRSLINTFGAHRPDSK